RMRVALGLKAELDWHTQHDKKIQYELDLATHVQRSLLSPPLNEKDIRIEVSYLPSSNLAGDMYYWYKIDDHRYAIILLDMMGHGI
ncbi:PP2C family protein-serine/threonine phosphatase, partial [Lysinibacillus fusiformis]|uniref:PP2C family protein-serine/threonine phosphatase n=1 Tax=Lysinibacillus fusiformis TaxID=28031 RepID=UPI003B97A6A7